MADRHNWQVVLPTTNLGFGAGMNAGVARARSCGARYFLLLNPDATIDRGSLQVLRERVADDNMMLVAPVVERPDGSVEFDGVEVRLSDGSMRSARSPRRSVEGAGEPWLTGACLLVAEELWARVGGFAEDYFLYWEDVDLSRRARLVGARLEVERAARAVHDEGGTQRRAQARAKSSTYYYYNTRNRLLYAAHHLPVTGQRRWLLTAPAAARAILLRGGRRQFLRHPVGPLRAVWRGTWHGMRLMRASRRQVPLAHAESTGQS